MLIGKEIWKRKWRIRFYAKRMRLEHKRNRKMRKNDIRQKDSEWKDCERVNGKDDKININIHFEGWLEDGGNMNEEIHERIW